MYPYGQIEYTEGPICEGVLRNYFIVLIYHG